MEKVTGIGGVFIRAHDPEALGSWYERHLGVTQPPRTYDESPWTQESGPTVFAAMPQDSEHLGKAGWSLNFRVRDLDLMVAQLRAGGIDVTVHQDEYPNGRFADLTDPEGNPIQLWQPTEAR